MEKRTWKVDSESHGWRSSARHTEVVDRKLVRRGTETGEDEVRVEGAVSVGRRESQCERGERGKRRTYRGCTVITG
jgi:hypothetical protein